MIGLVFLWVFTFLVDYREKHSCQSNQGRQPCFGQLGVVLHLPQSLVPSSGGTTPLGLVNKNPTSKRTFKGRIFVLSFYSAFATSRESSHFALWSRFAFRCIHLVRGAAPRCRFSRSRTIFAPTELASSDSVS